MRYLLDTNIVAYILSKRPVEVFDRLQSIPLPDICISTIVVAELWFGINKSQKKAQNKEALEKFLNPLTILNFDSNAGQYYGMVRADLETKGLVIGANDLLIAAHALSLNLALVTNNTSEFKRVEGLKIENWITE